MTEPEHIADSTRVRDDGRVIVDVGPGNWVRLIHQDHASYFVPPWEARSLAQRLLLAANAAEHIDGLVAPDA